MAYKNQEPSQLHDSVGARVAIVNADGVNYKNLMAIPAGDQSQETHLFSISVTSDDTVAQTLRFAISDGVNDIEQGDITIAINSGFGVNTPPVQIIANRASPVFSRCFRDIRGNWFIALRPGETLKVKSLVAVSATKTIAVSCMGWRFTRT